MRSILSVLIIVFFVGCDSGVNITRFTTYSYYFENGKVTDIQLIGTSSNYSGNFYDTLFDTMVLSKESIMLMTGIELRIPKNGTPMFKSNGIEKCDSVFVLENGRQINSYANPYKFSPDNREDSVYMFFNFNYREVYVSFDTIYYDSKGPQPEEVKFKYILK